MYSSTVLIANQHLTRRKGQHKENICKYLYIGNNSTPKIAISREIVRTTVHTHVDFEALLEGDGLGRDDGKLADGGAERHQDPAPEGTALTLACRQPGGAPLHLRTR